MEIDRCARSQKNHAPSNIELGAWLISCLTVWAYCNERKGIALGFLKQHPNFIQIWWGDMRGF
jgi:hypothetical protein